MNIEEDENISLVCVKKELYKKILFAEYLLLELEEIIEKNIINKKKFEKEFEKEIEKISKNKMEKQNKENKENKEENKINIDIDDIDDHVKENKEENKEEDKEEDKKEDKEENKEEEIDKSIIGKLYRILALKFHPDKNPDNKDYEVIFKNINDYNKEKNLLFMIILCKKYDVKFNYKDISKRDQELIDKNMKQITDEIIKEKTKVHWMWFNSDDNEKMNIRKRFMELNDLN